MAKTSKTNRIPLTNQLAWQGWHVALPADWNPSGLTGDHRNGTAAIADLEQPRLELRWRRLRSRRRVDLTPKAWPRVAAPRTPMATRWRCF